VEAVSSEDPHIHLSSYAYWTLPGHITVLVEGAISIDSRIHIGCVGDTSTERLLVAAEIGREITRQALAQEQALLNERTFTQ
jgi:hypothetical protein